MRKFRVTYLPTYDIYVYYVKCTRRERRLLIKRTFGQEPRCLDEYTNACFEVWEKELKKGLLHEVGVIWEDSSFKDSAFTSNIFVHELLHCVHWILGSRGMTLTDSSQEAYAYLMGFLCKDLKVSKKKAQ